MANTLAHFVVASVANKKSHIAMANTLAYFVAESVTKRVL
jgi:hypothetical protein